MWITWKFAVRLGPPLLHRLLSAMTTPLWKRCLDQLEEELPPQQFNTWIRPLQAVQDTQTLRLPAPNRFVVDWVRQRFLARIGELVGQYGGGASARGGRGCVQNRA